MSGFAARGAASIQYVSTGAWRERRAQQRGAELCRLVLHADVALLEARQRRDIARVSQHDAIGGMEAEVAIQALLGEPREVRFTIIVALVDAQRHRPRFVVGLGNGTPLFGPGAAQLAEQPLGVFQSYALITVHFGLQRIGLALQSAQATVEHASCPLFVQQACGPGGFPHGGVSRGTHVEQLIDTDQQQRLDIRITLFEGLL